MKERSQTNDHNKPDRNAPPTNREPNECVFLIKNTLCNWLHFFKEYSIEQSYHWST